MNQESFADTLEIFCTSSSWACFSPPIKVPGITEWREHTPLLSVALFSSAGSHRIKSTSHPQEAYLRYESRLAHARKNQTIVMKLS